MLLVPERRSVLVFRFFRAWRNGDTSEPLVFMCSHVDCIGICCLETDFPQMSKSTIILPESSVGLLEFPIVLSYGQSHEYFKTKSVSCLQGKTTSLLNQDHKPSFRTSFKRINKIDIVTSKTLDTLSSFFTLEVKLCRNTF